MADYINHDHIKRLHYDWVGFLLNRLITYNSFNNPTIIRIKNIFRIDCRPTSRVWTKPSWTRPTWDNWCLSNIRWKKFDFWFVNYHRDLNHSRLCFQPHWHRIVLVNFLLPNFSFAVEYHSNMYSTKTRVLIANPINRIERSNTYNR